MMIWLQTVFAVLAIMIGAMLPPGQARATEGEAEVDLLLVLAADVSRSVDEAKFRLQRQGYAAAVADPRVLSAIKQGANGRIAMCYVEWAGVNSQAVIIDWTVISGEKQARIFGDRLLSAPRSNMDRTSISAGIDFAMAQLARSPFSSQRHVIDVSGDGTNNSGRGVTAARDDAVAKGVTINGLPILSESPSPYNPEHTHPPGGLPLYYEQNVIGGPGAFIVVAENFDSFARAIVSKLIKEIADDRSWLRTRNKS